MDENYKISPATTEAAKFTPRSTGPGPALIVSTLVMLALNLYVAYLAASLEFPEDTQYASGYRFGSALISGVLLQLFVMGLFLLGPRFRNLKSMMKIVCWASLIALVFNITNFGGYTTSARIEAETDRSAGK